MVWVYNDPLTQDQRKAAEYLQKHLKKRQYITKIIKLLSLLNYLKSKKFRSSEQLRSEIFLDKERPLFDEKTALQVYKGLYKKRGGGPFTEHLIKQMAILLESYDPFEIGWIFEDGLWVATLPVQAAKGILGEGVYDLASGVVHGAVETGVSGVNGVAADLGGPVGLAIVGLFTGIAAGAGAGIAISEGDFAQAVIHAINFLPGIGPALVKGLNKAEHLAKTVEKDRKSVEAIPFIGETLSSWVPSLKLDKEADSSTTEKEKMDVPVKPKLNKPPINNSSAASAAAGGKRFSVRRRIRTKWPKTQRQRFARR